MTLASLLIDQITYLDDWAVRDREHSLSLAGATAALVACPLHLPVMEGVRADVQLVKDSISSVVHVVLAMGSSMYHLLSRAEELNFLVSALTTIAVLESVLLDACGDLLASIVEIPVKESSLRTHLIQLQTSTGSWALAFSAIEYLFTGQRNRAQMAMVDATRAPMKMSTYKHYFRA
ncbi:AUGMIN subunit 8-like [Aristolochia californica]|uniref:AUGMIN subunit 8-like n=1 Tax=Aristolochia californica TaxID=171875 RepID=UPI0035D66C5B